MGSLKDLQIERNEEFKQIIQAINRCLEGDWSSTQLRKGMMFEIRDYWQQYFKLIKRKYKNAGWEVSTVAELTPGTRKIFLKIEHPTWAKLQSV